ncbi:(2Fe-2S)-binding protein [Methylobacterium radiodurans]|uniref:(2Fe-2S)-binding protein n=1 Tax=Methylobacterium radiodurans TaxID=2202828 RepID=A0A2U8VR76_9HYPH|nr:(2Fe-2S)-binding protein [Methylobacterium radiodurans]AWN36187.1 (2Fe-2S)-binding protein [Methylobacterium radiodurans]
MQLDAHQRHRVRFTLNGAPAEVEVEPRTLLTDALRHGLGLTGTHVGCEHGVCGACTVAIDGVPARACLTLAVGVEGCNLRTVEGLAPEPGRLGVLQAAFRRHHALQCGFCTAGILMSLDAYLRLRPRAGRAELTEVVGGHLCRCTGYASILAAALEAAAILRGEDPSDPATREATDAEKPHA